LAIVWSRARPVQGRPGQTFAVAQKGQHGHRSSGTAAVDEGLGMQSHACVAESKLYRALGVAEWQRRSREEAVEAFVGGEAQIEDVVQSSDAGKKAPILAIARPDIPLRFIG
jgi:hypothetical protein